MSTVIKQDTSDEDTKTATPVSGNTQAEYGIVEIEKDKETEIPKEDTPDEHKKTAVAASKNPQTNSPKTPRSFMRNWIGHPRKTFGCCLTPSTRDEVQAEIEPDKKTEIPKEDTPDEAETAQANERDAQAEQAEDGIVENEKDKETEIPKEDTPDEAVAASKSHPRRNFGCCLTPSTRDEDEGEIVEIEQDKVTEIPKEDTPVEAETAQADGQSDIDKLALAIANLHTSVDSLSTVITDRFAKDPLDALKKEREELSKFVSVIGGLFTVASFSSPPGGLDSEGYIRFRDTQCYRVYLVLSNLGFMMSYGNLAQLHKPLVEQEQEAKAKALRKKINTGWFLLWFAVIVFFASFTTGFWMVYPEKKKSDPKTFPHSSWPRWFVLGLSIAKVGGSLAYIFGRRVWTTFW